MRVLAALLLFIIAAAPVPASVSVSAHDRASRATAFVVESPSLHATLFRAGALPYSAVWHGHAEHSASLQAEFASVHAERFVALWNAGADDADATESPSSSFSSSSSLSSASRQYLVHVKLPVTDASRAALEAAIAPLTLGQYIPHGTFVVVAPASRLERLAAAPSVLRVTEMQPQHKVAPEVWSSAAEQQQLLRAKQRRGHAPVTDSAEELAAAAEAAAVRTLSVSLATDAAAPFRSASASGSLHNSPVPCESSSTSDSTYASSTAPRPLCYSSSSAPLPSAPIAAHVQRFATRVHHNLIAAFSFTPSTAASSSSSASPPASSASSSSASASAATTASASSTLHLRLDRAELALIDVRALTASRLLVRVPARAVRHAAAALAALPLVHAVAPADARVELQNKYAHMVTQAGDGIDAALIASAIGLSNASVSAPPDALRTTPIWWRGLLGQGQVVGVGDTGIDNDLCFFIDPNVPLPVNRVRLLFSQRVISPLTAAH